MMGLAQPLSLWIQKVPAKNEDKKCNNCESIMYSRKEATFVVLLTSKVKIYQLAHYN